MKKQITTWQEAFEKKGLDANVMPDVSMLPEKYRKSQIALFKLHVIAEVLNDGWEPDYSDRSQWKYTPWFTVEATKEKTSGVGLSFDDCGPWAAFTVVGVRLCFKDEETAEYAGKQFKELYEDLFLKK